MLLAFRRVIPLVLIALTLRLFLAPSALAADASFNTTTSPLPVLLSTKPGVPVSTKLRIQNSGSQSLRFHVDIKKFKASGTGGTPVLLDRQPGDDFFDWVSFSKTSFTADPGQWNEVTMTVNVPKEAAFGYYYAVVFSKEGAAPTPTNSGSAIKGGTAVLVLLEVQVPGEKKELKVTSFSADKKLYEYLPAAFSVKVHNTGNIHLSPSGNVFITRGKKTVATLNLNQAGGNVLPGTDRIFETQWKDGFPVFETKLENGQIASDKNSQPVRQLHWDFSHANRLRLGHYTAHMVLVYDNGTRDVPVEAEVSFWVVPWKILPILILVAVLVGIGLWTSLRNIGKRVRKRV